MISFGGGSEETLTLNSKSSSSSAVFITDSMMNYEKRLVEKGEVVFE